MAVKINSALQFNLLNAGILGGFGTSAIIRVYDGTQPATAGGATTANLLVEITGLSWSAGTSGTALLNGTCSGTAGNSGTATWVRLMGTDGSTFIADEECGPTGSKQFDLGDDARIIKGERIALVVATITQTAELYVAPPPPPV